MEWIACEDRLPDADVTVCVSCCRNIIGEFDKRVPWVAYYGTTNGGKKYWFDAATNRYDSIREVTHWMPLPPPPNNPARAYYRAKPENTG